MASNSIKKIVVVGASGNAGGSILRSLIATNRFELTVLSRPDSKANFPDSVTVKRAGYTSDSYDILALQKAFEGQDAAIITLSFRAAQDDQPRLIEAAIKAGVKWILPNEFACDGANQKMVDSSPTFKQKQEARQVVEKLGGTWIGVCTGPWPDYSMPQPMLFGIDVPKKKIQTWQNMGRFTMSTLPQVGRAVAALLSLPIKNQEEPRKSLEHYENSYVYVQSFTASQEELFAAIQRATSTTPNDWNMKVHDYKRLEHGQEIMKSGANPFQYMADTVFGAYMQEGIGGNVEKQASEDMKVLDILPEDFDDVIKRLVAEVQAT